MIKIGPLVATDYGQACSLLGLQEEPVLEVVSLTETGLVLRSLAFWQHWVPCRFHVTPSIYVAREEGMVLGFISLHNLGKSKTCWRVDNLVVDPEHRGRGIAQELLRYVFAQFGSQGVSHFIAEVAGSNDAALSLFAACGFCRTAQVTYYRLMPEQANEEGCETGSALGLASGSVPPLSSIDDVFKPATTLHRHPLFELSQDALPPDLRLVLGLAPEDFRIKELPQFTAIELKKNRLLRRRVWYLVSEDTDRKTLTASARITAQPGLGYRLDFAVHPGWRQLSEPLVKYAVNSLLKGVPKMPIWVRVYDFDTEIHATVKELGFERMGDYFLLAREHWQRAKHPKKRKVDAAAALKPITRPAINFPLASEQEIWRAR